MSLEFVSINQKTVQDLAKFDVTETLRHIEEDNQCLCFECLQPVATRLTCAKCRHAVYCGKDCQIKAWKHSGHKISCGVTKITRVKGKGFGVVAVRNIKMGEVVMMERPLLNISFKDRSKINEEIRSLDDSSKRKLMALSHGESDDNKLATILMTNSFEFGPDKGLLYNMLSRFNHSCVPNIRVDVYSTNPDVRFTPAVALKDIHKDEELVCNYLVQSGIYSTREVRQQRLLAFGINKCLDCPACSLTGEKLKESDQNRIELKRIEHILSTTRDPSIVPSLVEQKRKLLKAEGLDTMNYLMMLSKDLSMASTDDPEKMKQYRDEALEYAKVLHDEKMIEYFQYYLHLTQNNGLW